MFARFEDALAQAVEAGRIAGAVALVAGRDGVAYEFAKLTQAAQGQSSPLLMINADAQATHQSVVNVMEAARQAGIVRLNFAAQTSQ